MFTATSTPHPEDPERVVIVATAPQRGLTRYCWSWNGGTQIAIADRAADTHSTRSASTTTNGRRIVDSADMLVASSTPAKAIPQSSRR